MVHVNKLYGDTAGKSFLSAPEASHMVYQLRAFVPQDVDSPAWLEQHHALEALSVQSQADACCQRHEFVKEAIVEHDKMSLIVADLLVTEAWTQRALPLLRQHIADSANPVIAYALVHHEATAAALLETVLHHADAAVSLSEEAALELCDWCARKVAFLSAQGAAFAKAPEKSAQEIMAQSASEEIVEWEATAGFTASLAAVAILRHLTDHAAHLSLGVLHRISGTHGVVATLVLLLLRMPWERRGAKGELLRWEGGAWVKAEIHQIGTTEAQTWLLLCNLTLDPAALAKQDLTDDRLVESLLQLRPRLTPARLDQLPILQPLLRFLEALSMGAASEWQRPTTGSEAKVVIDQPPKLRAALVDGTDWKAVAEEFMESGMCSSSASEAQAKQYLDVADFLCDMGIGGEAQQAASEQAAAPVVNVEAYYDVGGGRWAWHAAYRFRLKAGVVPEQVRVQTTDEEDEEGEDGGYLSPRREVSGSRYRMEVVRGSGAKALPRDGKLVVTVGDKICETLIALPSPPTRDTSELPPALWVTAGSLRDDGMVLQIKVKKLDRAQERDGCGAWCAFVVATGGAFTVRDDLVEAVMGAVQ